MQFAADSPDPAPAVTIPALAHKRGGLLAQIEADMVDDTVPVSSLLQKCIVLGGQAWAVGVPARTTFADQIQWDKSTIRS